MNKSQPEQQLITMENIKDIYNRLTKSAQNPVHHLYVLNKKGTPITLAHFLQQYKELYPHKAEIVESVIKLFAEAQDDENKINLYERSLSEIHVFMTEKLTNLYHMVNVSLDTSKQYGFNKHDISHINKVVERVIKILKALDYKETDMVMKRAVIAAYAHDIGNLIQRKNHSLISPLLLNLILPSISKASSEWTIVKKAIELHDEPVTLSYLRQLGEIVFEKEILTSSEILYLMDRYFSPESMALIIADKIHIGRERISAKALELPQPRQALKDEHLEVNLLGRTHGLKITDNFASAVWQLDFTPSLGKEEYILLQKLIKNRLETEERVVVSDQTNMYHNGTLPIPHFNSWKNLVWKLYFDRIILTIYATFTLFKDLKTFTIEMRDRELNEVITQVFDKKSLNETVTHLYKTYRKKG